MVTWAELWQVCAILFEWQSPWRKVPLLFDLTVAACWRTHHEDQLAVKYLGSGRACNLLSYLSSCSSHGCPDKLSACHDSCRSAFMIVQVNKPKQSSTFAQIWGQFLHCAILHYLLSQGLIVPICNSLLYENITTCLWYGHKHQLLREYTSVRSSNKVIVILGWNDLLHNEGIIRHSIYHQA